jgi:hypothetical protein
VMVTCAVAFKEKSKANRVRCFMLNVVGKFICHLKMLIEKYHFVNLRTTKLNFYKRQN